MLSEITWAQLNEWEAYFELKSEYEQEAQAKLEKQRKEKEKTKNNLQAAKRGGWQ